MTKPESDVKFSLPAPIEDRLTSWKRLWMVSAHLYYILGGASALCAAISATSLLWPQFFAAASAVITSLFAFIQPEKNYLKMVRAWRVLDSAAVRFQLGLGSVEELHKALDRGEQIITEFESSELQPKNNNNNSDKDLIGGNIKEPTKTN